jgi:cation:H+ antiporter
MRFFLPIFFFLLFAGIPQKIPFEQTIWTIPIVILAALVIAWAAEAAQFIFSQALALAILAWLQTLPEFAVEAKLAWDAAHNPARIHEVTANFTGSIRLLMGFGVPLIYLIFVLFAQRKEGKKKDLCLDLGREHSVEIIGMFTPLIYIAFIILKGTLNIFDGIVLISIYLLYLSVLHRLPPQQEYHEVAAPVRFILRKKRGGRLSWIGIFFAIGGGLLYLTIGPFVGGLRSLAEDYLLISSFFMIQWLAPFLTEFPEKISAFYWASNKKKAPMGIANFLSSNINQWTLLVGMIPMVYSVGKGSLGEIVFDTLQKEEIALTLAQSTLCFLLFIDMKYSLFDAFGILGLFLTQFLFPHTRGAITLIYIAWILVKLGKFLLKSSQREGFNQFLLLLKEHIISRKMQKVRL